MSILSKLSLRNYRKRSSSAGTTSTRTVGIQTEDFYSTYSKYIHDCDKYAVVYWYNYRKELHAGFLKNFPTFDQADRFALSKAEEDKLRYHNNGPIITERQITDNNGPGKNGSPYAGRSLIGYGGRDSTGYATTFYCVVPWFEGVENSWDELEDSDTESELELNDTANTWYPKYSN